MIRNVFFLYERVPEKFYVRKIFFFFGLKTSDVGQEP